MHFLFGMYICLNKNAHKHGWKLKMGLMLFRGFFLSLGYMLWDLFPFHSIFFIICEIITSRGDILEC